MNCQKCGQETFLPFQCLYCGGQFCSLHRLPENHACPKIELAQTSKREGVEVSQSPKSYQYSVTYGKPRMTKGRVYFSPKELKHLAIAGLLVMGIGLSSILYYAPISGDWLAGLLIFGLFAVVLTASFFAHEIAKDLLYHIVNIVLSLSQVFILNFRENSLQIFESIFQRPGSIDFLFLYMLRSLINEDFILQDH